MNPVETSDLLARLKAAAFPGVDASALPDKIEVWTPQAIWASIIIKILMTTITGEEKAH